jgi:hypothetical protein
VMISTHPFTWRFEHRTKAFLSNGGIVHVEEPEYHGNPVDPKGSLVFTIPGWKILEDCRECGFRKAEMLMIASTSKGIFGGPEVFINVLRAYK